MSDSKSKSPQRRPSSPKPAMDALLAEPSGNPIRRALWLDGLDLRLRPHLPPSVAAHARLANINHGRLVFVVDGPVWAAKLRLAAPDLLTVARSLGLEAVELIVKTTLPPATPPALGLQPKPMSATARQALQAALASLKVQDKPEPDDY